MRANLIGAFFSFARTARSSWVSDLDSDHEQIPTSESTPSSIVANRELLEECRARLSDEERQIVELRTSGMSWSEIAERLGVTSDAVRMRFSRSVDRVATELGLEESVNG